MTWSSKTIHRQRGTFATVDAAVKRKPPAAIPSSNFVIIPLRSPILSIHVSILSISASLLAISSSPPFSMLPEPLAPHAGRFEQPRDSALRVLSGDEQVVDRAGNVSDEHRGEKILS